VLGGTAGSVLLSFGAVVAVASVVLAVLYGQTRILFSMSRDGLVPRVFSRVNPRTGVPSANTVLVSSFIAVLAAVVPLGALADATSIGTLFAFGLVNIAVLVLRRTRPDLPRTFRAPLAPITPILGVVTCGWMMFSLDSATWVAFGAWMAAGLVVYFAYSRRHSALSCAAPASPDNDSSISR
jgi:basic amino acid/polyamine antiporter, APA family